MLRDNEENLFVILKMKPTPDCASACPVLLWTVLATFPLLTGSVKLWLPDLSLSLMVSLILCPHRAVRHFLLEPILTPCPVLLGLTPRILSRFPRGNEGNRLLDTAVIEMLTWV